MLTDTKIRAAKPAAKSYRLGDSGQLYLQVTPAGGKLWRLNYTFGRNAAGKPAQKTLALGAYPTISLAEARERRDGAKRLLSQGKDPAVEQKAASSARATAGRNTFRRIADEWFEFNSGWSVAKLREWIEANDGKWSVQDAKNWTLDGGARWSDVHSRDVFRSLERDVMPELGKTPICDLTAAHLLEVLRAVEARGAIETTHRLRQRLSAIFVYGISIGACSNDPASTLGRALKPMPPSSFQPAITDGQSDLESQLKAVQKLLRDAEAVPARAQNKLAIRLLALTAVRPGVLATARWEDFEGLESDTPVWLIPAKRLKGDKFDKENDEFNFAVPLARQAAEVIVALRPLTGRYQWCFPNDRHAHRYISGNTLRALLIRAGYFQQHVPHGFRTTFSTIMNERAVQRGDHGDREVIDLMLAHVPQRNGSERSRVSASEGRYNRASYMQRRRELAQQWADLLLEGFEAPGRLLGQPMRWTGKGPCGPGK